MTTAHATQRPAMEVPVSIARGAPHDAVAEWRLHYLLVNGGEPSQDALDAIRAADLKSSELTEPELPDLFERALALDADGHPVDEVTITAGVHDLALRDALDAAILRIRNMSYAAGDARDLVARIRNASALRQLQSRAHNLNVYLRREGVTVEGGLAEVSRLMDDTARMVSSTQVDADGEPITNDGIWRPRTQELADLMNEQLPATRYFVDGLIPEGLLLVAGKAKHGKTTLMCYLCASVAAGALARGELATQRAEVLYIAAEDQHNKKRMQRRMRQMLQGEPAPRGFHIEYSWPRLDQGGLQALDTYCEEHPAVGVIVLDTLERVRAARRNGGGYQDDYAAVADLQTLAAKHQIAIVVLHHLRKASADDPFDEINASMGLMAAVDNMIVFKRGQDGLFELHRRGREYDDDEPLALQGDRDTLCWRLAGKLADVTRSEARSEIIALLRQHPTGLGPTEIAAALGKNLSTIKTLLGKTLAERAPVVTSSGGRYFAE